MRRSLVGALLVAGLVIATLAESGSTQPASDGPGEARFPASIQDSRLFAQVTAENGQPLTVTVIDPRQRVMGVYHVDRATGEIVLRSVRNLTWDLQMVEFNSGNPLPQDIRSGLGR